MTRNPILDEIYAAREKLLADADGDIHKYIQQARERLIASGRPIAEPTHRTTDFDGQIIGEKPSSASP